MKKTKYLIEKKENSILILMQLLTFDIYILKGKNKDIWLDEKIELLPEELRDELLKRKFLVLSSKDDEELKKIAENNFKRKRLDVPSIAIYLTNKCNLRCSYCYSGYQHKEAEQKITSDDIDKIFESIDLIYENNEYLDMNPIISLYGGEPLLHGNESNIEYIISKQNQKQYEQLMIVTNLVNIKMFKEILEKFQRKLIFKVTLNGDEILHDTMRKFENGRGTYQITLNNMKFVLENLSNTLIELSVLLDNRITNKNITNLFQDLQTRGFLKNNRVNIKFGHIQFRTQYVCSGFEDRILNVEDYYPMLYRFQKDNSLITRDMISGSSMHLLNSIYEVLKDRKGMVVPCFTGCGAVYPGRFCFFTDGEVYPCFDCVGMDGYSIGNYRKQGLYFYENYKLWKDFDVTKLQKCTECKFIGFCNGGCLTSNKSKCGNIMVPYCENVEASINKFLDYCYEEKLFDAL